MSKVRLPSDFATCISDTLGTAKSEVDEIFEVGETKDGYFYARLLPKQWLKTEQFTMLCALARDLGGDYVKEKRMWRVPGPMAKSEPLRTMADTSPSPASAIEGSVSPSEASGSDEYFIAKSVGQIGYLYPVLKDAQGNVIDGVHRLNIDPNWPTRTVEEVKDATQLVIARLIANVCRRNVSKEEKTEWLRQIATLTGWTPRQIADNLPVSYRWVMDHIPDEFKERPGIGGPTEKSVARLATQFTPCSRCGVATSEPVHLDDKFYCGPCAEKSVGEAGEEKEVQQASALSLGEEQKPFADEPSIVRRKFDVWNIAAVDVKKAFGDADYPGAIPGDIVGNVLLWFLPDGGRVVDPMAGGGVTEDVCNSLGSDKYRCFLFDSKRVPNYKYRETVRFNDIANGSLPIEDGSTDLVFVDPPYGPLKEYGMTTEAFERVIAGLAQASYKVLRLGGKAAVLMQNYYEGGECTGKFVPLIRRTAEIFAKHGFTQVFEGTVPLHGKVARNEATMTHIDRRLMVFQK